MSEVNEKAAARDATNWAKAVSTLNVSEVPEGAININVEGKRLAGPIQGFGKMWQKTYQVRLPADEVALTLGGHKQEDRFWNQTLSAVAAHFGRPEADVETQVVCVDKKRQWSRW